MDAREKNGEGWLSKCPLGLIQTFMCVSLLSGHEVALRHPMGLNRCLDLSPATGHSLPV